MSTTTSSATRDVGAPSAEPTWQQPGGLGVEERRSWATWQLVTAALLAVLVGMVIGYSGKKPSKSSGEAKALISLGGSSPTPTVAPRSADTTVTTIALSSPTLPSNPTTPSSLPSATATTAPLSLLMANTTGKGPSSLPGFTAGATWNIGWAFRCVLAPGGSGTFTIAVVSDSGAGGSTQAVTQTSRDGQGITPQSTTGRQHLQITTDPACQWAVKVTGVAG